MHISRIDPALILIYVNFVHFTFVDAGSVITKDVHSTVPKVSFPREYPEMALSSRIGNKIRTSTHSRLLKGSFWNCASMLFTSEQKGSQAASAFTEFACMPRISSAQ